MLFRNPRFLPLILLIVGLAMAGMRWQSMQALEPMSAEDIETAIELNYALDITRMGMENKGQIPEQTEEQKAVHMGMLRRDIMEEFVYPREQMEREFEYGLILALLGALLQIGVIVLQRRQLLPK